MAAALCSGSAAAGPKRVTPNPQRIGILQRLCRSVQRVCHVRMNAGDSRLAWTRAHSASDRLIVSKGPAGTGIDSPDVEIVHGSRGCRGNVLGNSLGKGTQ